VVSASILGRQSMETLNSGVGHPVTRECHLALTQQMPHARNADVPTKSGPMLGLGETDEEILEVMRDLRTHDVEMPTLTRMALT